MANSRRPIHRALVSVFHKEGIEVLAQAFVQAGTEVVSTGSTAQKLAQLGVQVTPVEQVTGFPESLDGRVKTLDPHVHAGILADMTNPEHAQQLEQLGIKPFDLVVVNLYPFADTVRSGADEAATIEKIDIGGPSMVRGAAKNSATVAVITDPKDYALVAERVTEGTGFTLEERRYLAAKAFAHTAAYDATITQWTERQWQRPDSFTLQAAATTDAQEHDDQAQSLQFAQTYTRTWDLAHVLRYGENPHQQAALYIDPLHRQGFAHAEQLGGKPMSYNNYVDADAAWRAVWDFAPSIAVAVVKHNNPCGLAVADDVATAHKKAHACDPVSAYGGVIAANTTVTLAMAESVRPIFTEVIVAPDYEPEVIDLFKDNDDIKLVKLNTSLREYRRLTVEEVILTPFGALVQDRNNSELDKDKFKVVTREKPTAEQIEDAVFAWKVVKHAKTNAVVIARDFKTVAIAQGQTNSISAVEHALNYACDGSKEAVLASDSMLTAEDCIYSAVQSRIGLIIQPGGSIKDKSLIDVCDKYGIAMITTGIRNYRQ